MSELQAASEVTDGLDTILDGQEVVTETEQPNEVSESAPDTGENQEQKTEFSAEQQRIFDEAIAKKVFKAREAERKAEALQKELEETKAKLPQKTRPTIPGIPDSLELTDEEFQEQLRLRDEAIREAAAFDAQEKAARERQEEQERQRLEDAQKALEKRVETYTQNALKLGVTNEELTQANQTVNSYGIDQGLADYIMDSPQGPLIAVYLQKNPLELDALRGTDPINAAVYVETVIKPKAATLKAKVTQAPEPAETLSGAGIAPSERGPKGATFE